MNKTLPDRATLPTEIEITPAMIEAGASLLASFDRLEWSVSYARQLAEEIISQSLPAASIEIWKGS